MKLVTILFIMVAYTVLASMVVFDSAADPDIDFPTLDVPDFNYESFGGEGSCGSFDVGECIEFLGRVMRNIGIAIRNIAIGLQGIAELIFNLVVYALEVTTLILDLLLTGIEGAPWYLNLLITIPFIAAVGLILFKLVRSGESED